MTRRSRHSIAARPVPPSRHPPSSQLGQQAWASQVPYLASTIVKCSGIRTSGSDEALPVWCAAPSISSTNVLCLEPTLCLPAVHLTVLSSVAGSLQPGEVSPSPSAERKEWGPFGSPVELSAAAARREGTQADSSSQQPFPAMPASADAGATGAASAPAEASAVSQRGAAEQQHAQQQPGSARAQPQDSRSDLEAEQGRREHAEGPPQALPPENWAPVRYAEARVTTLPA